jgi:ABC-type antimicrobial peptide transport system permease subunit
MALGAGRSDVLRLVLRDGMSLVLVGVVAGIGLSLMVSRTLASLLLGIGTTDATAFVTASLLLAAVGLLASYWPDISLPFSTHRVRIFAPRVFRARSLTRRGLKIC